MRELPNFVAPIFVPGNRPERFVKAAESGADAVILDLEDAVAANEKDAARESLHTDFTSLPIILRLNGVDTPWIEKDIACARGLRLAAIMLPKAELNERVERLAETIDIPIIALIESALGLAEARMIAKLLRVRRLAFGSVDYAADLRAAHVREAMLGARSELVLASRLAGLPGPLDGVTLDVRNVHATQADAKHAAELGFWGKLAIHPRQVPAILTAFLPSEEEVASALKVLQSTDGAVAVDGQMVDEPVRIQARQILEKTGHIRSL